MTFQVTARKWRPKDFTSIVGQTHVTQSLKNAIQSNRIAQSYLFSGPRGVGKTTIARILVTSLNCANNSKPKPCGICIYCVAVATGKSLDYMEIDGASNRGIDQIREINENLKYPSPHGNHRVFVIDEVHMLTIEAFNALLKSLEEPPPKVIFVFCTTESHKVPATIRSRCQHYSFRAFSIPTIIDQLKFILEKEKISSDEEALFCIAKAANGSMRDSQSILDQVIAYSNGNVILSSVLDVLGLNSSYVHLNFLKNLHENHIEANRKLLSTLYDEGKDIKQFVYELIDKSNVLIFIKEGIDDPIDLEVEEREFAKLKSLSKNFELQDIYSLSDLMFEFLKELRQTTEVKITADLYLLKLHRFRKLISPEQLKSEILNLSKAVEPQETPALNQPQQNEIDKKTLNAPKTKGENDSLKKKLGKEGAFQKYQPITNGDIQVHLKKENNVSTDKVKNILKSHLGDSIIWVGVDGKVVTLEEKKEHSLKELNLLKSELASILEKEFKKKFIVNILKQGIDDKTKESVHEAIKIFNGNILNN